MRETKKIQLQKGEAELYTYATGGDAKSIFPLADKPEATDEMLKRVVVSVNGQTGDVIKLAEELELQDYITLIKEATSLFSVDLEKKTE
jgi:hypothetical protein